MFKEVRYDTQRYRTIGTGTQTKARTVRADSTCRARLILLLAEGCAWAESRAKLDAATATLVAGASGVVRTVWQV
jgi:hypothetical protein